MASNNIVAAGGLVWRDAGDGSLEVLVVHRPRYDDWSWPKGKVMPGEHVLVAAAREVLEETGVRVRLGPPLGIQRYDVRKNGNTVPKLVHYWSAQPLAKDGPAFRPNDEVDEIAWLSLPEARERLSYPRDVELVENLESVGPSTSTVVLLRHTAAMKRKDWAGKDARRPLTPLGAKAAKQLVDVLTALGVDRVLSSDAERCAATVAPYAAAAGLPLEERPEISEEGHEADPEAMRAIHAWATGQVTAICSHRPVLPALARTVGLKVGKFSPGAILVAHRLATGRVLAERFSGP